MRATMRVSARVVRGGARMPVVARCAASMLPDRAVRMHSAGAVVGTTLAHGLVGAHDEPQAEIRKFSMPKPALGKSLPDVDHIDHHVPKHDSNGTELHDVPSGAGFLISESEVKDPGIIFQLAFRNVERAIGRDKMQFPKEIIWLAGAPGAGKGTNAEYIMELRGITAPPIETSSLFSTPAAIKLKEQGVLLGDRDVVEAVLRKLLEPVYQDGVIVDGFPRTQVQAECILMLYDMMKALRQEFANDTAIHHKFRRPRFRVAVLYVEEGESVKRQLARGKAVTAFNKRVSETGVGKLIPVRSTDVSEDLAKGRYRAFKEEVYAALTTVKTKLPFHFVPADSTREEVRAAIFKEFHYQSSMELADETFEMVRQFVPAHDVTFNARGSLVKRLDGYCRKYKETVQEVLDLLNREFKFIISRQALAGQAVIRSQAPVLQDPVAMNICLDILAERGYTVVLDVIKEQVPYRVDLQTGAITTTVIKSFVFNVSFPKPTIRQTPDPR